MNSLIISGGILRRMLREKSTIGFVLVVPVLVSLMLISLNPGSVPVKPVVGIANSDQGPTGAVLLEYLERSDAYQLQAMPAGKIASAVTTGQVSTGVIIPADFTAALNAEGSPRVTLYQRQASADGEAFRAGLNRLVANLCIAAAVNQAAGDGPAGQLSVSDRYLELVLEAKVGVAVSENRKAENNFIGQIALGFLIMILMLFGGTMTGSILEDKRKKTFMRAFSTPLQEYELVLGNLMAYVTLGVVQITTSLLITTYIFQVNWGTSPVNVFLILSTFLFAALGLSIGIAGFVSDHEKFVVVNNLVVSPTCLLGGCFIPLQVMPVGMRLAANLLPQKWAMEALQKLSQGALLSEVATNLLILLLFGLVFFTFGVKTLKPGVEDL